MRYARRCLLVALVLFPLLAPGASAQVQEEGRRLYEVYCGVCHGADGQGVERAFPPLVGSRFLLEDPERTIDIILHGLLDPIRVDEFYEGAMPPIDYLSDEQVAAIMNYVLKAWGNDGGTVTPEEVEDRRRVGEAVRFRDPDR